MIRGRSARPSPAAARHPAPSGPGPCRLPLWLKARLTVCEAGSVASRLRWIVITSVSPASGIGHGGHDGVLEGLALLAVDRVEPPRHAARARSVGWAVLSARMPPRSARRAGRPRGRRLRQGTQRPAAVRRSPAGGRAFGVGAASAPMRSPNLVSPSACCGSAVSVPFAGRICGRSRSRKAATAISPITTASTVPTKTLRSIRDRPAPRRHHLDARPLTAVPRVGGGDALGRRSSGAAGDTAGSGTSGASGCVGVRPGAARRSAIGASRGSACVSVCGRGSSRRAAGSWQRPVRGRRSARSARHRLRRPHLCCGRLGR